MKKKIIGKLTSFLLVIVMCVSLCIDFTTNATDGGTSQQVEQTEHVKQEREETAEPKLRNPTIEIDSSMTAGQNVTWDCVWFGSYPQAEVVPSANDYTAVDESMLKNGDIIENSSLYSKQQNATGWNSNNDITVDGYKYRRMNLKVLQL